MRSSTAGCPSRRSTCRAFSSRGPCISSEAGEDHRRSHVVVSDVDELIDTCSWIDWAEVLDTEQVVIYRPGRCPCAPARSQTDLSFIFDPNTRICTIGGGLMDQVTHVALWDDLCTPHGLDYYIEDFRYTWWRSHNGFEASRLAPDLERKRITRLVSHALIERFPG